MKNVVIAAGYATRLGELTKNFPKPLLHLGTWHTLRALESGTVIIEMKDGAYVPIGADDVLNLK